MGPRGCGQIRSVTSDLGLPPAPDEFEVTVIGPGYGESVLIHLGRGEWILVDSCIDSEGVPRPLRYLEDLGVDPAERVRLVVATHWHDDHIRGMGRVVARCRSAGFCCSSALRTEEFLTAVGRSEASSHSRVSSGVRELHEVFSHLAGSRKPLWALADRRLYGTSGSEVCALSPDDAVFGRFLESLTSFLPDRGATKKRIPDLSPNEVSVALWVRSAGVIVLCGADLERAGWQRILVRGTRPEGAASAFKVPHHGAGSAHEPGVWEQMLTSSPVAVLTPWARGGRSLPTRADQLRILGETPRAYATAPTGRGQHRKERGQVVGRTLREMGAAIRRDARGFGAVRLRRGLGGAACWRVDLLGAALRLGEAA